MSDDNVTCPYCNDPAEWVDNARIYGRRYGRSYMMWVCWKCDTRVTCHENTKRPMGPLADKETRELRHKAHNVFDQLWKTGLCSRKDAYRRLSKEIGVIEIHIGQSNTEQCKKIIEISKQILKNRRQ